MSGRYVCVFIFIGAIIDVIAQNRTDETCGVPTKVNQHPWLVGIEFQGVNARLLVTMCTGALINRRHVVSNAECFDEKKMAKFVQFGPNITINGVTCTGESTEDCNDRGETRVPIEAVIVHPNYSNDINTSGGGDIAVIRLRDVVHYTDNIQPICIPSADIRQSTPSDRKLHLAGIYYDVPPSYTIKHLGEPMSYLDTEESKSSNICFDTKDQICAKKTQLFKPGDILGCMFVGGLLVNKRGDRYELIGLGSYGLTTCLNIKLFTNFYLYLDWIRSVTPDWTPCGTRRVKHVELIVNGENTKAGDWPWHVAIYRFLKSKNSYICGGTLISKKMVLTAAHCVTISGVPVSQEILSVVLGKYYLIGANIESQEKEVQSVIAHEGFSPKNYLENDIALLKLQTEAIYSDYVQPACIWYREVYNRLPGNTVFGTVVGWGFNEMHALSSQLKQSTMPKISNAICIQRNPLYYSNALYNNKKFCAGWANGTSVCNGDSGGGFLVFVPDTAKDTSSDATGSWYVRGVVSMSVSLKNLGLCDPNQYAVFTDVENYIDWVRRHMDD